MTDEEMEDEFGGMTPEQFMRFASERKMGTSLWRSPNGNDMLVLAFGEGEGEWIAMCKEDVARLVDELTEILREMQAVS